MLCLTLYEFLLIFGVGSFYLRMGLQGSEAGSCNGSLVLLCHTPRNRVEAQ